MKLWLFLKRAWWSKLLICQNGQVDVTMSMSKFESKPSFTKKTCSTNQKKERCKEKPRSFFVARAPKNHHSATSYKERCWSAKGGTQVFVGVCVIFPNNMHKSWWFSGWEKVNFEFTVCHLIFICPWILEYMMILFWLVFFNWVEHAN